MEYPRLYVRQGSREIIDEFRGYNHNLRIGRGEFYDMKNLTSDYYPVISPRKSRGRFPGVEEAVQGMVSLNGLCYVAGGKLYYGEKDGAWQVAEMHLSEGEKQLIAFGAYIIVMPDKRWLNTVDGETGLCEIGEAFQGGTGVVWCKADGEVYETVVDGDTEPENHLQMWVKDGKLLEWNETLQKYTAIEQTYLKVIHGGIGIPFEEGSRVMFVYGTMNGIAHLCGKERTIWAKDRDWIVVEGNMPYIRAEGDTQFVVEAKMPLMDFVFEHENRLWGCRYGLNNSGEFVNEIYASKLGDFKSWNSFKGVSTDSYIASCGTDGPWTGAIKALGHPLFFKENYLHKVYGSYPANYQIQVMECRGVREGCHKSMVTVNEVLYYLSRSGVCAYDGSLPACISDALGNRIFRDAVAGRLGNKYYISMKDGESVHLFAYDTRMRLWHREDHTDAEQFCTAGDSLCYTNRGVKGIYAVGSGEAYEGRVEWSCETGVIGASDPDHKYISRINLRMEADFGTEINFFAQYDSVGSWVHIGTFAGRSVDSVSVPLRIRRCDHLRLRFVGKGDAKIYSMTLNMEKGSDIR